MSWSVYWLERRNGLVSDDQASATTDLGTVVTTLPVAATSGVPTAAASAWVFSSSGESKLHVL